MAVDYAAIAKKYGGVPSNPVTPTSDVDYAAIAKKYGGVPSNPVTPTSDVDYAAIAKKYGGVPTTPPSTPLAPVAEEQSIFRSAADVPLQLGAGVVGGVGLLADVLGVNNPISQAIHGVESYLDSLLSAQAKNDQQEVSRIMQEAEDKGVKENVLAGFKALSVAPVDLVSRAVGYSAPTIAAIFAGAPAVVPVGVGALMGVGTVKSAIFDTVKSESMRAGLTEDKAEEVATQAQAYTGDNLDMIATGGFLGALSSLGIEKPLANIISQNVVKKLVGQGAAKAVAGKVPQSALKRSTTTGLIESGTEAGQAWQERYAATGLIESGTEAGQAWQERYAANKAAQRAGYEVPTYRGVSGAAALEGLVGGVAGVGVGALKGPETEVDTKSDIEKEFEEEIDKTIGKETYDEKLEFEILRKVAASKGVSITPEDTIDTLADKIEQKDFEADMAKAPGQVKLPPAQVIPEKLREDAAANGIEIAAEDTEEDVINKIAAKLNTTKQTLEEAETTAPVKEAVAPAPVEEAVTPAPIVTESGQMDLFTTAPVKEAVAPAPVEQPTPDYAPFSNLPGVTHVFKTARGSTYAHTETGQTVRNRSSKNHTDLTVGLQPTSGKTIYLTEAGVNTLGGILQNVDIATQLVPAKIDGKDIAQVVLTEDYGTKKKGDVLAAAPYELTPRKGLVPVEIWRSESALGDDAQGIHFGNKIIEITPVEKTKPPAPVEEAVTPAPVKEAVTPAPVEEAVAPAPIVTESGQMDFGFPEIDQELIPVEERLRTFYQTLPAGVTPSIPISEPILDALRVPKQAALRKKVLGKDLNSPEVQNILRAYATNDVVQAKNKESSIRVKRALNINRMLQKQEGIPETQIDLTEEIKNITAKEKKAAIQKQAKERREAANKIDPAKDSLLTAIAKLGGYGRSYAELDGIDPAEFTRFGAGIKRVFTKNGRSLSDLAETLAQDEYPVFNENGDYDENVLLARIDESLRGKQFFSTAADKVFTNKAQEEYESLADQAEYYANQETETAPVEEAVTPAPVKEAITPSTVEAVPPAPVQKTTPVINLLNKAINYLQKPFAQESKATTTQYTEEPAPYDSSYDVESDDLNEADYESLIADLYPVEKAAEETEAEETEAEEGKQKTKTVYKNETARRTAAINAVGKKLLAAKKELKDDKTPLNRKKVLSTVVDYLGKQFDYLSKGLTAEDYLAQAPEKLEGGDLEVKAADLANGLVDLMNDMYTLANLEPSTGEITNLTESLQAYFAEEIKKILTSNEYIPNVTFDAVTDYVHTKFLNLLNIFRTAASSGNPAEGVDYFSRLLVDKQLASENAVELAKIIAANNPRIDFLYSIRKAGSLLPKDIIDLATSGKLMPVLSYIGANTKDPVIKRMITKILGMKLKTKLVVSPATDFEYPSRYDAKADTIFIDPSQLMDDVFLHEIIHPVLMAALNNPNLKVTKDFTDVFNEVKKLLPNEYGTKSVQEFASELLANADFRAKIKAASKTNLLTRIIKAIAAFFNFSSASNPALYDRAMVTLEGLIDVTAVGGEAINEGVDVSFIKEPQNLTAIKNKVEAVTTTHTELNENISALYKATRQAKNWWNDVVYTFLGTPQSAPRAKYILGVYSTDSLFKLAADAKLTPLERLKKLREKLYAYRIQIRQKDDRIINLLYKWASKDKSNSVKLGKAQNAARIVQVDPSIATLTEAINTDDIVQRYKDAARDSKNKRDKEYYEGRAKRRIEEIKYAYRQYNALDEQGKNLYKIMRDTYKQEILDYETIIKENIKVIIDAFKPKAGATPAEIDAYEKQIANLNKELSPLMKELFSERHKISVYFPLGRHGNFWVRFGTGKNGITETFDSREARDLALELRRNEMRKTAQQKNEVFDEGSISIGDDINELSNKLFGENNKLRSTVILKNAFEEIEKLSSRLDLDTATGELTVASAAIEGLKENFLDLYLRTLPGSDLRKRYIRSKNKAGFTADVIRTFVNYSYRRSNQLPRAKYNAQILNELDAAESFLEGMGPEEKASATKLTNEIKNRLGLELSPTVDSGFWDWLASTSNQATFLYIMTSFKSAIATATQLPIVGLPILADKYGYTKASSKALKHLGLLATLKTLTVKDFYQDANGVTNFDWRMPTLQDSSYVKNNARLVDAFQQGSLGQAFDSGFGYQFSKASEQPTAQYLSPVQKTKRGVYSLMTTSIVSMERIAREIMFISSYELEFEKALEQNLTSKEAHERAIEKAIDLTKEGMGNFTKENKPPIMYKTPIGKSLFQFMSFPMYMFGYLFRNFAGFFKALKDKNPAQAKSALVQLTGTYGAVFLLAGLPGLPLYSVFAGMLQGLMELLKDKEEEYPEDDPRSSKNMDLWIRRHGIPTYFGDENVLSKMFNIPPAKLQQAIEMGPLSALTDVNLQSFTSLDGLFLRDMAYGDDILSGINQFAKDFFLPPSIEATTQLMSSIEKINSGDFERGFEGLLPAFFRGSATASRLAKEGARTPSGDKLSTFEGKELNPEWYTTGKLIAVSGGFKDVTQSQIEKANSIAKKLDLQTQKQRTELVNRLDNAYQTLFISQETKNTTAEKKALDLIDSVWAEMLEFNEVNPYYAFSEKTVNAGIENREKNRALASVLGGMRVDKDRIAYFMRILNRQ